MKDPGRAVLSIRRRGFDPLIGFRSHFRGNALKMWDEFCLCKEVAGEMEGKSKLRRERRCLSERRASATPVLR